MLLVRGPAFAEGDWNATRQGAVNRTRRIIFNNDGNEPVYFCKSATEEALLRARTTALVGSQVDSIFYCTWSSGFGMFTHNTKAGQVFNTREGMFATNRVQEFLDKGIDPLAVMAGFAHRHQMELFWSLRMNDTHDGSGAAYGPPMFRANKLKQEHPEYLIGSKERRPTHGVWSAVDYGVSEIRELAFRYCDEVCHNYDADGVELDFFRHPFFFKSSGRGEACSESELNQMTDLIRRIREMMEAAGRNRNRPILLAVRVPDSVEYCKFIGIDLERWLSHGLIDLLIAGGYTQLNPWEYSVALGRKYGVKVYPSLDEPRVRDQMANQIRASLATYRGRALEAWSAGADGIYMFNFFDSHSSLWNELGDPKILTRFERNYFACPRGPGSMPVPHQKFIRVSTLNPNNPIALAGGKSARLELLVGEDFSNDSPATLATLRIELKGASQPDVEVRFNSNLLLKPTTNGNWIEFEVPLHAIHKRVNTIEIASESKQRRPVSLLDCWLAIKP